MIIDFSVQKFDGADTAIQGLRDCLNCGSFQVLNTQIHGQIPMRYSGSRDVMEALERVRYMDVPENTVRLARRIFGALKKEIPTDLVFPSPKDACWGRELEEPETTTFYDGDGNGYSAVISGRFKYYGCQVADPWESSRWLKGEVAVDGRGVYPIDVRYCDTEDLIDQVARQLDMHSEPPVWWLEFSVKRYKDGSLRGIKFVFPPNFKWPQEWCLPFGRSHHFETEPGEISLDLPPTFRLKGEGDDLVVGLREDEARELQENPPNALASLLAARIHHYHRNKYNWVWAQWGND